jgi:hypothetical protein
MSDELVSWPRPHYQPGGGDAMIFYAMYGAIAPSLDVSRTEYRSAGLPPGVQSGHFSRGDANGVFASFLEGPFGAMLDDGFPQLSVAVRAAAGCVVIKGTVADSPTLDYLRDVIGLVACMIDAGAIAVLDMQALQWWDAADFRRDIFEAEFTPAEHVAMLGSMEDSKSGAVWIHTRGMRKFGRPDLSVHGVTDALQQPVVEMCARLIALQALGGVIPEGQTVKMDGIPAGSTCHHGGDLEDPDFNNVHLEVRLPK